MRRGDELKTSIDAFEAKRDSLEKHYKGKHVLFHDGKFVDAFDTFHNAAEAAAVRRFRNDTYLIREVGAPGEMPIPAPLACRPVRSASREQVDHASG